MRCDEKQPVCGRFQRRKTSCTYTVSLSRRRTAALIAPAGDARVDSLAAMRRLLLPSARLARPTRLVEPSATFLNALEV